MKKSILFLAVILLAFSGTTFGKSKEVVEVLYFKAKQCACKTRTCNAVEDQVKSVILKDFPDENIEFKRVWLNEKENEALIQKYSAKPQTVIMVRTKKDKEIVTDLTEIVHQFSLKKNQEEFEKQMKTTIAENL